MNRVIRRALFHCLAVPALLLGAGACSHGLAPHRGLLVGAPAEEAVPPAAGEVAVTYLGVNGYLLHSASTSLLVDPYFTRVPLRRVVLDAPIAPSGEAIRQGLAAGGVSRRVDAVLVTHAHFDHLLDIPAIQRRVGGKVIVSPTGGHLCRASGVPGRAILPSLPGHEHRVGNAIVHVLPARHDKVLGRVPWPGRIDAPPGEAPTRPSHWRLGVPLAFLVELEGRRIYIESGGLPGRVPGVSGVDLAIVGVAVRGSQKRYPDAVRALNPRHVLPSHQDNFFLPLEGGFHFSSLANFPRIVAVHETERLPGELLLMDYFHTWVLP